jgi:decaprenylphospho-beta-D-ribofuranose 2-oxidase
MQLADRVTPAEAGPRVTPRPAVLSGWGRIGPAAVSLVRPDDVQAARLAVPRLASGLGGWGRGAIARGLGRSYGDAAQRHGGVVIDTTALTAFELDATRGLVRAQAGVTLGALLAALQPAGWVLPVVPGTQHVTVGGAIAADIHGKNHACAGTFGAHVDSLQLLTADGEVRELGADRVRELGADHVRELGADRDAELLRATVGGMGLTGVIVSASIRLKRLNSPLLSVDSDRVTCLEDALSMLDGPGGEYRVAWLDLLGPCPVRGIVTRAAHVEMGPGGGDRRAKATVAPRLTVPARWPGGALRPGLVRAYNAYRFHRAPRSRRATHEAYGAHMFPLDGLDAWPRLYGSAGLVQYQLAVPKGREEVLHRVIGRVRGSAVPCYLAVLKDLGPGAAGALSFPMAGWTLALDMPGDAPGLAAMLDAFDEWVAEAGGRVYLAKDGRSRPEVIAAMYPLAAQWRATRDRVDPDGVWASDLGVRTGLVDGPRR